MADKKEVVMKYKFKKVRTPARAKARWLDFARLRGHEERAPYLKYVCAYGGWAYAVDRHRAHRIQNTAPVKGVGIYERGNLKDKMSGAVTGFPLEYLEASFHDFSADYDEITMDFVDLTTLKTYVLHKGRAPKYSTALFRIKDYYYDALYVYEGANSRNKLQCVVHPTTGRLYGISNHGAFVIMPVRDDVEGYPEIDNPYLKHKR